MRHIYLQICDYPKDTLGNLIQPYRKFIKEGELLWVNNDGQHSTIWVILFNDIIIFCIKGDHVLIYKEQMQLLDSKITTFTNINQDQKESMHLFRVSSIGRTSFIVGDHSESKSSEWFDVISENISERQSKANFKRIKSKRDLKKLDMSLQKGGENIQTKDVIKQLEEDDNSPALKKSSAGSNLKGLLGPMNTEQYSKKRVEMEKKRVLIFFLEIFFFFVFIFFLQDRKIQLQLGINQKHSCLCNTQWKCRSIFH